MTAINKKERTGSINLRYALSYSYPKTLYINFRNKPSDTSL